MSTPTPRTDMATYPADCLGTTLVTNRDCSRALERELNALTSERDKLRAEVERLKPYVSKAILTTEGTMLCSPQVAVKYNAAIARAERAEAEAERYRLVTLKQDAELATERARLADLIADLSDACITLESAENDCDDYAMQNTAFKLMAVRNVFAAMKEDAK